MRKFRIKRLCKKADRIRHKMEDIDSLERLDPMVMCRLVDEQRMLSEMLEEVKKKIFALEHGF